MAARLPRSLRLRPPGGPEHAAGDGDGVGAREPHDPDRRRAAAEGGDDGRDGPGSAAPAAVVLARLVRGQARRRGRALVAGEDEGVRARGQGPGAARGRKEAAAEEADRRRAPPWEEEREEAGGGAGHRIGMSCEPLRLGRGSLVNSAGWPEPDRKPAPAAGFHHRRILNLRLPSVGRFIRSKQRMFEVQMLKLSQNFIP